MTTLPEEFVKRMRDILGEEYPLFERSYEQPRQYGLRVNAAKIAPEEFERLSSFHLQPIPWLAGAYTYLEEDHVARHPYYAAGLYYLQEPSAMTPASVLRAQPGERVLDLCAAPGGKATALGAALRGEGILVANDISASRTKALLHNLESFGIGNLLVTNEKPEKMTEYFPAWFDRVLVDAPCSGEGMFRKDESTIRAWYPEKSRECADIQKKIILHAADMLRPGGRLLYSTCTFSPEENEKVVQYLLENRPEFRLIPIPEREGFAPGLCGMEECVRLWPHRTGGEGHFLALLEKAGALSETGEKAAPSLNTQTTSDRKAGKKKKGFSPKGKEEKNAYCPDRQASELLEDFFRAGGTGTGWLDRNAAQLEVRQGKVYLVSGLLPPLRGITFVRNGLYLGELKKDRFEPSQALAMALKPGGWEQCVNFDPADERVGRYLRGETLSVSETESRGNGWKLVCVDSYPLGWARKSGTVLKNKYHPGWRVRY